MSGTLYAISKTKDNKTSMDVISSKGQSIHTIYHEVERPFNEYKIKRHVESILSEFPDTDMLICYPYYGFHVDMIRQRFSGRDYSELAMLPALITKGIEKKIADEKFQLPLENIETGIFLASTAYHGSKHKCYGDGEDRKRQVDYETDVWRLLDLTIDSDLSARVIPEPNHNTMFLLFLELYFPGPMREAYKAGLGKMPYKAGLNNQQTKNGEASMVKEETLYETVQNLKKGVAERIFMVRGGWDSANDWFCSEGIFKNFIKRHQINYDQLLKYHELAKSYSSFAQPDKPLSEEVLNSNAIEILSKLISIDGRMIDNIYSSTNKRGIAEAAQHEQMKSDKSNLNLRLKKEKGEWKLINP